MRYRPSTLLILLIVGLSIVALAGLSSKNEGLATLFGIVCCMPLSMIGGPLLLILIIIRIVEWTKTNHRQ